MNNLLSYYGLIDAKIRASDIDLHVLAKDKRKNRCPKVFVRVGLVCVRDSKELILTKMTTLGTKKLRPHPTPSIQGFCPFQFFNSQCF